MLGITDPLSPPANVMLTSINSTQLVFRWNPVRTYCSAIKYIILAENCGSCPAKSNTTTVICTNPQPQPNPGTTCSFRVQTEICEGVVGGASDTSIARLRGIIRKIILCAAVSVHAAMHDIYVYIRTIVYAVPDTPVIVIIPTYSQSEKTLISTSIMIMETVGRSINRFIRVYR
jgi:hypothetical protein